MRRALTEQRAEDQTREYADRKANHQRSNRTDSLLAHCKGSDARNKSNQPTNPTTKTQT